MIFNLFKSKPTLRELIPKGFVDIHSHILPGIDDGAKNIEESMELISKMKKLGFSKIIGTPHTYTNIYDNTNESISDSFDYLNSKLDIDIKIGYASEYMLEKNLIERAEKKSILCIAKNYVLVEMSYSSMPIEVYDIIFKLKVNDYIPILAHPERYLYLRDDFKEYMKLKKFGCLFQGNLLSTVGYYGPAVTKNLNKLLKLKMIDFMASDIHNVNHIKKMNEKIKTPLSILEDIINDNYKFL